MPRIEWIVVFSLFLTSTAHSIEISLESEPPIGSTIEVGSPDSIYVNVILDTEGFSGITLLSTAVIFDETRLKYDRTRSTTTAWLLYNEGMGEAYLYPAKTCDGKGESEGLGCAIWITTGNQINVDFICTALINGTSQATGTSEVSPDDAIPGGLLATLVFDVLPTAVAGPAEIAVSITSPGNVIGTTGGGETTATLTGSGAYNIIVGGAPPTGDAEGTPGDSDAGSTPGDSDAGSTPGDSDAGSETTETDTAAGPTNPEPAPEDGDPELGTPDVGEDTATPAAEPTSDVQVPVSDTNTTGSGTDAGASTSTASSVSTSSGGCQAAGTTPASSSATFWALMFLLLAATRIRKNTAHARVPPLRVP